MTIQEFRSYPINKLIKTVLLSIRTKNHTMQKGKKYLENIKDGTRLQLGKKICLCMIVKNESRIIERCLNSAKPIIDFVSICDTGSNDKIPEIIENWCKEHHIPGTVHHKDFKNLGYNRTLSARLA